VLNNGNTKSKIGREFMTLPNQIKKEIDKETR
jgi:hypothetical protein